MSNSPHLPPICWVTKPKHISECRQAINEGIDYCPECAQKIAQRYKARFPKHAEFIEACIPPLGTCQLADSPAQCGECAQPLACTVGEPQTILDTEEKWNQEL